MPKSVAALLAVLMIGASWLSAGAQYFRGGGVSSGNTTGTQGSVGGSSAFGGGSAFGNSGGQALMPGNTYLPGYGSGYGLNSPVVQPSGIIPSYPGYGVSGTPGIPVVPGFVTAGPLQARYWRAASGYYYPFGIGSTAAYQAPIYYANQAQLSPSQQIPPLYSMFADMLQYLDQSKKERRVNDADYSHLYRRLQDLRSKYDHLIAESGTLDPSDEDSLRKDAALLSSEMAMRIKPLGAASKPLSRTPPSHRHDLPSGWSEE